MDLRYVLVVDDDAVTRAVVAKKLVKVAITIEAEDGVAAFRLLRQQRIDLIIVDLEMPNLGGIDLIGLVRGHPSTKHIPIIVLTSDKSRDAFDQALQAGATSFLNKPLNWQAFGAHIIGNLVAVSRPTEMAMAKVIG
ncbi:MAG: response regulator [Hyphomicrobiaceae bacterium]|nr:response regulator [Hyphomicrobiaceae bacterium]